MARRDRWFTELPNIGVPTCGERGECGGGDRRRRRPGPESLLNTSEHDDRGGRAAIESETPGIAVLNRLYPPTSEDEIQQAECETQTDRDQSDRPRRATAGWCVVASDCGVLGDVEAFRLLQAALVGHLPVRW